MTAKVDFVIVPVGDVVVVSFRTTSAYWNEVNPQGFTSITEKLNTYFENRRSLLEAAQCLTATNQSLVT